MISATSVNNLCEALVFIFVSYYNIRIFCDICIYDAIHDNKFQIIP